MKTKLFCLKAAKEHENAERIAAEDLNLYANDPWGNLGRLNDERFRAVRDWQQDLATRLEWAGEARAKGRAVFFGGDELGDQVVGGGRTASLDVVSKKGAELLGRGDGGTFDFGAAAGLIHRHHGVGPVQQIRPEGVWNAQEPGDDRDGQGAGKTL